MAASLDTDITEFSISDLDLDLDIESVYEDSTDVDSTTAFQSYGVIDEELAIDMDFSELTSGDFNKTDCEISLELLPCSRKSEPVDKSEMILDIIRLSNEYATSYEFDDTEELKYIEDYSNKLIQVILIEISQINDRDGCQILEIDREDSNRLDEIKSKNEDIMEIGPVSIDHSKIDDHLLIKDEITRTQVLERLDKIYGNISFFISDILYTGNPTGFQRGMVYSLKKSVYQLIEYCKLNYCGAQSDQSDKEDANLKKLFKDAADELKKIKKTKRSNRKYRRDFATQRISESKEKSKDSDLDIEFEMEPAYVNSSDVDFAKLTFTDSNEVDLQTAPDVLEISSQLFIGLREIICDFQYSIHIAFQKNLDRIQVSNKKILEHVGRTIIERAGNTEFNLGDAEQRQYIAMELFELEKLVDTLSYINKDLNKVTLEGFLSICLDEYRMIDGSNISGNDLLKQAHKIVKNKRGASSVMFEKMRMSMTSMVISAIIHDT
jgi:hypothetical protein